MPTFLLDSSVMVAAVCSWHEHHQAAIEEIERRLKRRQTMIVAAPTLVETYAVLTRLPSPHRLSSHDAKNLIESNFLNEYKCIALDENDYKHLVLEAPGKDVSGGRTYDWVIALCAQKAEVSVLLTFNIRDFTSFSLHDVGIYFPESSVSG
ncbi:PIN domain-containing protein [Candidatus Nitrospira salsa]